MPIVKNWYGEFIGPKYFCLKNRIAWLVQSASMLSMPAITRFFICPISPSGNDGFVTTSAYTSIVLAASSFIHVAVHAQVLLPQMVDKSPPIESKNEAICC